MDTLSDDIPDDNYRIEKKENRFFNAKLLLFILKEINLVLDLIHINRFLDYQVFISRR